MILSHAYEQKPFLKDVETTVVGNRRSLRLITLKNVYIYEVN